MFGTELAIAIVAVVPHLDDDLPDGVAVGDVAQGGSRVLEGEVSADVRSNATRREELHEFALAGDQLVRGMSGEVAELKTENGYAFQQDEVQGYARNLA